MYVKLTVRTLLQGIVAFVLLCAVAWLTVPGYLLHSHHYSAILRYFPRNWAVPEALYASASELDPDTMFGPVIDILPGREVAAAGTGISAAQIKTAMTDLRRLTQNYPGSSHASEAEWMLANAEQVTGNLVGAKATLRKLAASGGPYADQAQQQLQFYSDTRTHSPGDSLSLTGTVNAGAHPLSGAFVFVRRYGEHSLTTPAHFTYPGSYTDEHGVFRIYNIPPGDYQVGVEVSPAQVSGYYLPTPASIHVRVPNGPAPAHYAVQFVPKLTVIDPAGGQTAHGSTIRFSWNPYPDAVSYRLSITSILQSDNGFQSVSTDIPGLFHKTSATFTRTQLRNTASGGVKDGEHGLAPGSVLGAVYPHGEFTWAVDAYDAHGKLLSSSRGYYLGVAHAPIFYTTAHGLLPGDKYLLAYQYDKAIQAYKAEGNDPYAFRALGIIALYGAGVHENGNPKQALAYFNRIKHPGPDVRQLIQQAQATLTAHGK